MRRDLLFKYLNYFIQHLIFHKKNLCNFSFILHNTGRSKLTLFLGTIASFNWDTTSTSNLKTDLWNQFHLANQDYDICIRRTRGYCSIYYSPQFSPVFKICFFSQQYRPPALFYRHPNSQTTIRTKLDWSNHRNMKVFRLARALFSTSEPGMTRYRCSCAVII